MDKIIITSREESYGLCISELIKMDNEIRLVKWLEPGVGIVSATSPFGTMSRRFHEERLIFLRHVSPLDYEVDLRGGNLEDSSELVLAREGIMERLDRRMTFSAQSRVLGAAAYNHHDLNHFFADAYTAEGFTLDPKAPEQVVSVVAKGDGLYIGLSRADENLSPWPGGMRRYARGGDFVSRSEMKLLEALEYFDLELPKGGQALDLGAAPGGWSKVLAERGLAVTAVDPAELSPKLAGVPGITHYRGLAQRFAADNRGVFDIVTNDMRMDVAESARLMLDFAGALNPGGLAVMTFKLPQRGEMDVIRKGLNILGRAYSVTRCKQLFHNRSEVIVVMTKR